VYHRCYDGLVYDDSLRGFISIFYAALPSGCIIRFDLDTCVVSALARSYDRVVQFSKNTHIRITSRPDRLGGLVACHSLSSSSGASQNSLSIHLGPKHIVAERSSEDDS